MQVFDMQIKKLVHLNIWELPCLCIQEPEDITPQSFDDILVEDAFLCNITQTAILLESFIRSRNSSLECLTQ